MTESGERPPGKAGCEERQPRGAEGAAGRGVWGHSRSNEEEEPGAKASLPWK